MRIKANSYVKNTHPQTHTERQNKCKKLNEIKKKKKMELSSSNREGRKKSYLLSI